MEAIRHEPKLSGVDWNPAAGHCLGSIKWIPNHNAVVVVGEVNLGAGYAIELKSDKGVKMFMAIAPYFTKGNRIVLEDGGINVPFIKWFTEMLDLTRLSDAPQQWRREEWDNQDVAKMAACTFVIQHGITIYVDKVRFPETAKQIGDAHWDEEAKGSNPKLAKDRANSPHWVDTFLHAISKKNRDESQIEMGVFY